MTDDEYIKISKKEYDYLKGCERMVRSALVSYIASNVAIEQIVNDIKRQLDFMRRFG